MSVLTQEQIAEMIDKLRSVSGGKLSSTNTPNHLRLEAANMLEQLAEELDTKQKELTSTALDYLAASGQAAENLERALEAEKRLEVYQKVIRSLYPDMSGYYFICGSGGAEDDNGLPERLSVCPAMGVGWSVTYVKTDQVSSVEGL